MCRAAVALVVGGALVSVLGVPPAKARMPSVTMDAWVREATLIVHARSLSAEGPRVRFKVLVTLKGKETVPEFETTLRIASCVPPPDLDRRPLFPMGTEVLLLLAPQEGKGFPVVGHGLAWLQLNERNRQDRIEGIARVVQLETLLSPAERMRAYLGVVEGPNLTLRWIAGRVISMELQGPDNAKPWEGRLASLVRSPVREARMASILALRFLRSEKALPALLEALRDENRSVRECASMALAPYDTEVTVRHLLEAARRPDMVKRVILDLRNSRRPEARAALRAWSRSEDPEIQKLAAGPF